MFYVITIVFRRHRNHMTPGNMTKTMTQETCSTWTSAAQTDQCMISKYRKSVYRVVGSVCFWIALALLWCYKPIGLCCAGSSRTSLRPWNLNINLMFMWCDVQVSTNLLPCGVNPGARKKGTIQFYLLFYFILNTVFTVPNLYCTHVWKHLCFLKAKYGK